MGTLAHRRKPQLRAVTLGRFAIAVFLSSLFLQCGQPAFSEQRGQQSLSSFAQAEAPARFIHPGLLNSQQQLDAFKKAAQGSGGNPEFAAAYQIIKDDPRSSTAYRSTPIAIVEVAGGSRPPGEKLFKDAAMAAYLNALQWVATGDRKHRDTAIAIMDSWAAGFQSMKTIDGRETVVQLESAWTLPMWANAAEIIRYYDNGAAGWAPDAVSAFDGFLDKLYNQASLISISKSNRGLSGALAMMSSGVYQNNSARYTEGLARLRSLIPAVIHSNGRMAELRRRDCYHPQYSLTAIVQAAEVASNQRDDSVWRVATGQDEPQLARGLDNIAKALTEGSEDRDCRGKKLLAGYAPIAAKELRRLKIAVPRFDALARQAKPDGDSFQFLGWSAATHGSAVH